MNHSFTIDQCEFGVDPRASAVELQAHADGGWRLSIGIKGTQEHFDALTGDEDSPWAWALYPPEFYARGIPVSRAAAESGTEIFLAEEGEFEMALYMMEHNEVRDLCIRLGPNRALRISGQVDLFGEVCPLQIRFGGSAFGD